MLGSTAMPSAPPDLAALAGVLEQRRRARVDQIEALLCTTDEPGRELVLAYVDLREIDATLARIADGTYGRCEVCGEPIAAGRLEARPAARTCVAHAR